MHMHSLNAAVARTVLLTISMLCAPVALADAEFNPVARQPVSQLSTALPAASLSVIVKLRNEAVGATVAKLASGVDRAAALAKRTGLKLSLKREISERMLASSVELDDANVSQAMDRLRADPAVEYVTIDQRRFPHATNPNDALFANQWYLKNTEPSSVNAIEAWDGERGSTGVVIAVLDTGVLYD